MSIPSLTAEMANSMVRLANMGDAVTLLRQKLNFNPDAKEEGTLLGAVQNIMHRISMEQTTLTDLETQELDPHSEKNKTALTKLVLEMREEKARQEREDRKVLFSDDKPLNEKTIHNAERFLAGNHKVTVDEVEKLCNKCHDAVKNNVKGVENCPNLQEAAVLKTRVDEVKTDNNVTTSTALEIVADECNVNIDTKNLTTQHVRRLAHECNEREKHKHTHHGHGQDEHHEKRRPRHRDQEQPTESTTDNTVRSASELSRNQGSGQTTNQNSR